MKRLEWVEDGVLSMQLRPDLYTLAQMRQNNLVQFFDITSEDGEWADVDLGTVDPLFCIYVATRPLKALAVAVLPPDDVQPNRRPTPTLMITYRFSGDGNHEADLIELTDTYTSIGATVVREGLTVEDDLDVIHGHEYVGMFGDPEKLRTRLVRWFDTGVNWDESKVHVFKGIEPPPPRRPADVSDHLRDLHPPLRGKVQPHFAELIAQLDLLPDGTPESQVLGLFQACIEKVNQYGDDIETGDREALLAAIYDIGATVGLDPESRFAERWRGDW